MADIYEPETEADAAAMIADAAREGRALAISGGNTRAGFGQKVDGAAFTSKRLRGIVAYNPSEMTLTAHAGTPVAEIEAELADNGQMMAFEPADHRMMMGTEGVPTIGGLFATNTSGPRRFVAGAARDSLLGIRFVNGGGEVIKSGGRVMKNVTGLDLVKLVAGSCGTLGFLTEVTFRVLPKPERILTLTWRGLSDETAVALLCTALGSPYEPFAAAHLPAGIGAEQPSTLLRLENFSDSIDYRSRELVALLAAHGTPERIEGEASVELWRDVRDARVFAGTDEAVWRLSVAPTDGPKATAAIAARVPGARWFYDWGGGLVWLAVPAGADAAADAIRTAIRPLGGHATLVRAPAAIRASVPVFEPLPEPLMRLTAGIKTSFDPAGIFEPGRMYAGI